MACLGLERLKEERKQRGAHAPLRAVSAPYPAAGLQLHHTQPPSLPAHARSTQVAFLASCDHPNVVRYLGSYRVRDALWIVMEHCGGGSVSDLISATGVCAGLVCVLYLALCVFWPLIRGQHESCMLSVLLMGRCW